MTLQSSVKVQGFKIKGHGSTALRGRNPSKSVKADFEYLVPVGLDKTGKFVARQKGGKADNRVVVKAVENLVPTQPQPYDAPVDGIFIKNDGQGAFRCGDAVWFVGYDNQYDTQKKDVVQVVNLRTFEAVETHVLNLCWFPDWLDEGGRKLITRAGHPEQLHNSYDYYFVVQELSDAQAATMTVLKQGSDPSWKPIDTDEQRQELFMQRLFVQDPTIEVALRRVVFSERPADSTAPDVGDDVTVKYLPATGLDATSAGAHADADEEEEQLVRTLQEDLDPVVEPRLAASMPMYCSLQGNCPLRSPLGGVAASPPAQHLFHFHWTDADCRYGQQHGLHCAFASGAGAGCICHGYTATHTCCEPSGHAAPGGAGAAGVAGLTGESSPAATTAFALSPEFDGDTPTHLAGAVAHDPYTATWLTHAGGTYSYGSMSPGPSDMHDGQLLVPSNDFSDPGPMLYTADHHDMPEDTFGGPQAWGFAAGAGPAAGVPAAAAHTAHRAGDALNELMPDMHLGEAQEFAVPPAAAAGGDDLAVEDPAASPPPGPYWGA